MVPERWSDDRLDDLAGQVRTVAGLSTQVGVQGANIDALEDAVVRIERLTIEIRDECRANAKARQWTPTQWAAVLGPTMAALIAAAAVLMTGGGS